MAGAQKIDATQLATYKKLVSQIELGYYSGHLRLNSVDFSCPEDVVEFSNEPVEDVNTSWKYSFERTDNGFVANVLLKNEITSDDGGDDAIVLEIGYILYYGSKMDMPDSLVDKFANEKVLPQVWPYFREHAKDLYFKAGLKWVIIPFEPSVVAE
jgi:hypothetical protein